MRERALEAHGEGDQEEEDGEGEGGHKRGGGWALRPYAVYITTDRLCTSVGVPLLKSHNQFRLLRSRSLAFPSATRLPPSLFADAAAESGLPFCAPREVPLACDMDCPCRLRRESEERQCPELLLQDSFRKGKFHILFAEETKGVS